MCSQYQCRIKHNTTSVIAIDSRLICQYCEATLDPAFDPSTHNDSDHHRRWVRYYEDNKHDQDTIQGTFHKYGVPNLYNTYRWGAELPMLQHPDANSDAYLINKIITHDHGCADPTGQHMQIRWVEDTDIPVYIANPNTLYFMCPTILAFRVQDFPPGIDPTQSPPKPPPGMAPFFTPQHCRVSYRTSESQSWTLDSIMGNLTISPPTPSASTARTHSDQEKAKIDQTNTIIAQKLALPEDKVYFTMPTADNQAPVFARVIRIPQQDNLASRLAASLVPQPCPNQRRSTDPLDNRGQPVRPSPNDDRDITPQQKRKFQQTENVRVPIDPSNPPTGHDIAMHEIVFMSYNNVDEDQRPWFRAIAWQFRVACLMWVFWAAYHPLTPLKDVPVLPDVAGIVVVIIIPFS